MPCSTGVEICPAVVSLSSLKYAQMKHTLQYGTGTGYRTYTGLPTGYSSPSGFMPRPDERNLPIHLMQYTVASWPVGIPVDQLNFCRFPAEVTVALLDARTELLVCFRMAARVLELHAKPHGDLPIPPPDRSSPLPLCSALLLTLSSPSSLPC